MEQGLPDYEVTSFFGIAAKAGASPAIVRRLNALLNDGLRTERTRALMAQLGVEHTPTSPEEFAAYLTTARQKWAAAAEAAGMRAGRTP